MIIEQNQMFTKQLRQLNNLKTHQYAIFTHTQQTEHSFTFATHKCMHQKCER